MQFFDWLEGVSKVIEKRYETIQLNGAVLIDGHHIFINVISSIDRFRRNPLRFADSISKTLEGREKHLQLLKNSKVVSYDPKELLEYMAKLARLLTLLRLALFHASLIFKDTCNDYCSSIRSGFERGEIPTDLI